MSSFQSLNSSRATRLTNIELMRIIAMLLILFHHGVVHGNLDFTGSLDFNKLFLSLFIFGGKFGVNIFVLISGYFLCISSFSIKKVSKIIGEILFYILSILCIAFIFYPKCVTYENIIRSIYPFQGFAINYIYLYLISPYINRTIINLPKEDYAKLLSFLILIMSFLPTFLPRFDGFWLLSWLILLYMLGAYIRKYVKYEKILKYHKKLLFISIFFIMLTNAITGVVHFIKGSFFYEYFFWINERTFFADNSFTLLVASLCSFMYFLGIKIESRIINKLASTMFGVLLLHDHPFRFIIFENILKLSSYQIYAWFPVYFISSMLFVFIVGVVIGMIRKRFFEKKLTEICEKTLSRMRRAIDEKIIALLN